MNSSWPKPSLTRVLKKLCLSYVTIIINVIDLLTQHGENPAPVYLRVTDDRHYFRFAIEP